ncbi:unnamed protein product [Sphagnum jensenii]|uniref:Dof-type domain-containing protein n=1 Tax=Sphagnum jensenii TaxID=128206 RepID=A0ABP0XD69_9BRYO
MKEERSPGSPVNVLDPAIKLFGTTIGVTGGGVSSSADAADAGEVITGSSPTTSRQESPQDAAGEAEDAAEEAGEEEEILQNNTQDHCTSAGSRAVDELGSSLGNNRAAAEEEKSLKSGKRDSDSTVTAVTGTETVTLAAEEISEGISMELKEKGSGQEIVPQGKSPLKKPDKLAPCPRCESVDTKFCYYNNYNVNQPRHFCKNCQRYWTAGGTLRNVPVGAGRRKNKHVGLQARHVAVADGSVVSMVRPDSRETAQQLLPSPGSRVSSGEISLMEGFPASGKVHQKPAVDGSQNGGTGGTGHTSEQPSEVDKKQVVNNCASSLPESVSTATKEAASTGGSLLVYPNLQPDVGGLYPKLPGQDAGDLPAGGTGGPFGFYNGAWPYGFNVRWNGAVPAVSPGVVGSGQVLPGNGLATWSPPPNGVWTGAGVIPWASPIPGMPGLPWIVPPGWGGGWTVPMPWAAAAAQAAASTANGSVLPGTTMPVLGKHSREWPEGRRVDGALWAPKTLRIDDPKDAARSSVWNALGMPNPPESVLSGSKFKAFQLKAETKVRAESQPQQVKQSTGQQL